MEPLLEVFEYGAPPFRRLLDEFRLRLLEEAASHGVDLVLTFASGGSSWTRSATWSRDGSTSTSVPAGRCTSSSCTPTWPPG